MKGKKKQCQIQRVKNEDGVVVEKRKEKLDVLAMHWEDLGKVSQSGEDVTIDNLKSKAKEVNWMMEPVGFREMFIIVKGEGRARC